MLEKITNGVAAIINDTNIKEISKKSVFDFVNMVVNKDPFALVESVDNTKKLLWQIPNAIFWDKMYRFMIGTYSDYECQIKMCEKFQTDNIKAREFIKKQIQIIEKFDFDSKVIWFSNLTRSFLLELINEQDYFKLSFALRMIAAEDIEYMRSLIDLRDVSENSILNLFYQHSLVTKHTPNTCGSISSQYNISELGIKFVKYGIDFQSK
ncbi:MAG: hypothetical protein J6K84_05070 [Oscillospiraceae bacterium]|nr:hypothetical protein [Oscillospiraceae bacterium]